MLGIDTSCAVVGAVSGSKEQREQTDDEGPENIIFPETIA